MTNSTTPLSVQEPAGAVEAIMEAARAFAAIHLRHALADALGRPVLADLTDEQDKLESIVRAALASLPPVTQAKSEAVGVVIRRITPNGSVTSAVIYGLFRNLPIGTPIYAAPQKAVAWREHVEQRLQSWRQRFVNKSGDQLALDDFMDKESLDDLLDYVLDEWSEPPCAAPQEAVERQPLTEPQITEVWSAQEGFFPGPVTFARAIEAAHGIGPATQEKP